MDSDARQHLAALIRARTQQHYGAWVPPVPYTYGLPPPIAHVAPLPNIGLQTVQTDEGAVSEAPGQQIGAAQPYAWLDTAPRTEFAATDPMAHSVRGGGDTTQIGTRDNLIHVLAYKAVQHFVKSKKTTNVSPTTWSPNLAWFGGEDVSHGHAGVAHADSRALK